MSNNWVVIIFLLFMVLMMSLYLGSQDYSYFAFTKSGLSEYPYEGFATYQDAFDNREGSQERRGDAFFRGIQKKEGFETLTDSKPAKLSGSSYVAEQKPVAFLYNNDANTTCKNYGYTNSKGFICMSSSDIQLLTTRGGNAVGASDQIGK